MKKLFNETNLNKAKNTVLAMFVFGSIGAYVGIQTMYAIDARQDDRINSVLRARSASEAAPVSPSATVKAAPTVTALPGK